MTRRNRQSYRTKLRLPFEVLTSLAPSFTPLHAPMIIDGYELQGSSEVHRTSNGRLTARLVYRPRSNTHMVQSLVITVRNIALEIDSVAEHQTMRNR